MQRRSVESDLGAVRPAAEWAEAILSKAGAGDELRNDVQVCLEEALANLIVHAKPRDTDKGIDLALSASADGATLTIADRCAPYDITDDAHLAAAPAPGEIQIGGNGIKLIRALTGRIEYKPHGDHNELRLEFGADAIPSLVRTIPALRKVPKDDLDTLISGAEAVRYAAGATLLKQGEPSNFALILLKGEAAIVNESAHGDAPLAQATAPAMIGEIGALSQLRRTASVRAKTDIEALKVSRKALLIVAKHEPELLVAVIAQTGQQIQSINTALGLYAAGLSALERDDFDPSILTDLSNPGADLGEFAEAFQRLANRVTQERRSRAELASAALIQGAMLPAPIDLERLAGRCTAFGSMKPARGVSGDLFDLTLLDDNRLMLVVGDVCGKGIPASLFMSATVTALRLAARNERDIGALIAQANDALYALNAMSMFTTLFYGMLDLRTGELNYVNCGHNPPLHITKDECVELVGRGPPLGFFPGHKWQAHAVQLKPGDSVFLFTDGVTECLNRATEEYGEARLNTLLQRMRGESAEALVQAVMAAAEAFADGAEQADDITCVAAVLASA